MTAAKHLETLSVEAYLAGELRAKHKHEYVGGYVYAMAGGRNIHNVIAGAFFGTLYGKLRGKSCQPFNSDTKVRVRMASHTRFYYPDGMVVCEFNPASDTFQDRPVILAEVLSPTTRRTDEGEKREAYLTIPTLKAYCLIESDKPRVVVYERAENGFVAQQYDGLDAVIDFPDPHLSLALAELYERVDFDAAAQEAADEKAENEQNG